MFKKLALVWKLVKITTLFFFPLSSVLPGILPKYLRATYGADAKIANNLNVGKFYDWQIKMCCLL